MPAGSTRRITSNSPLTSSSRTAAICADEAGAFQQHHDQHRADHGPRVVADATGDQRENDVQSQQRGKEIGCDERRLVRVQRTGDAQHGRADRERLHLECENILARDPRHVLIVADRTENAAERRVHKALKQDERHDQHRHDDDEKHQVELLRRQRAAPRTGDAGDAVRSVGQPDLVGGGDAYRFRKAKSDNGKIVGAQPRRDQRDAGARCRGGKRAGGDAEWDGDTGLGQHRRDIAADREEPGESEVDHPRHAPGQIHAERQQRVDARTDRHRGEVGDHQAMASASAVMLGTSRSGWYGVAPNGR